MIFKILLFIFIYLFIGFCFMIFLMFITRNNYKEERFEAESSTVFFGLFWPIIIFVLIIVSFYEYLLKALDKINNIFTKMH